MSRRRYISSGISTDTRVNRLATLAGDFAVLLYTWMIPHAADDGTLTGDPEELLATVVPMRRDKQLADVVAALEAMEVSGLILWERDALITFPLERFYKYQTYIPKDKRQRRQQRPTRSRESAGHVYLFLSESHPGKVKIGYSIQLDRRLKKLCKDFGGGRFLHTIFSYNAHKLETILHRKYHAYRVQGEWFDLSSEILARLCSVMTEQEVGGE